MERCQIINSVERDHEYASHAFRVWGNTSPKDFPQRLRTRMETEHNLNTMQDTSYSLDKLGKEEYPWKRTPSTVYEFDERFGRKRVRDPFYSQFSTKEIKNPSSPTSPLKRKLEIKRTNNRKSHHIQHEPIHHNMNYNVGYNCNCSNAQMMEEQVAKNSKKKQNECGESNELPELLTTEMLKLSPEEEWVLSVLSV